MPELQNTIISIRDLYREGLTVSEIAHFLNLNPDFVREHVKPLQTGDVGYEEYDRSDY